MKIYFSGSHATGKTTCVRYISEHYEIPAIAETARMVLSEKEMQVDAIRCNIALADKYQTEVFNRQILEEAKHKEFVSDRSAIDILAYSQHTRVLPKLMKNPALETYIASLRSSESIVFLVRPSRATLKSDGVRETLTWDGVVAIDAQIKLLYEMYEVGYIQINTDSMQERIRLIDQVLKIAKFS
jgi:predicted ATPase